MDMSEASARDVGTLNSPRCTVLVGIPECRHHESASGGQHSERASAGDSGSYEKANGELDAAVPTQSPFMRRSSRGKLPVGMPPSLMHERLEMHRRLSLSLSPHSLLKDAAATASSVDGKDTSSFTPPSLQFRPRCPFPVSPMESQSRSQQRLPPDEPVC